jgi:hypothetical protein
MDREMSKYFSICWDDTPEGANAFALNKPKVSDREIISLLEGKSSLPFEFRLKKVTEKEDGLAISDSLEGLQQVWVDYLPNCEAWPLMSERLKKVIENNLTGEEGIDWIAAIVNGKGEQRKYFVLRFTKKLDVLDTERTMFVPGTDVIIRPCFSLAKVCRYSIFHKGDAYEFLWKITPGIYVNEKLKKAIQKEKLTGIAFEKTYVV